MVFWQFFVLIAKVPVFYSISQKRMNNSDIIREEYVMLALYFAGIIYLSEGGRFRMSDMIILILALAVLKLSTQKQG